MNSRSMGKATFRRLYWTVQAGLISMILPLSGVHALGEKWGPLDSVASPSRIEAAAGPQAAACKKCRPNNTGSVAALENMARRLDSGRTSKTPQRPPDRRYFMPPSADAHSHPLPLAGVGPASFYNTGIQVASGDRFNPHGMTAAHRTLPFGSIVKVCRSAKKDACVEVCINDRGPFTPDHRPIDLAMGAFEKLAGAAPNATSSERIELRKVGLLKVHIYVVSQPTSKLTSGICANYSRPVASLATTSSNQRR